MKKDWKGFKEITEVSIDVFKEWLYDGYKQRKGLFINILKYKKRN